MTLEDRLLAAGLITGEFTLRSGPLPFYRNHPCYAFTAAGVGQSSGGVGAARRRSRGIEWRCRGLPTGAGLTRVAAPVPATI